MQFLLSVGFFLALLTSCRMGKDQGGSNLINIGSLASKGVFTTGNRVFVPDSTGIFQIYEIRIPEFKNLVYYGRCSSAPLYDAQNQIFPYIIKGNLKDMHKDALAMIFELNDGGFLSLTAMAGDRNISWFSSVKGKLFVKTGNLGTGKVEGDLPLFSWSRSDDLYRCCFESWNEAVKSSCVGGRTNMRCNKTYPEVFKYLGWCSWEQYHQKIDEKLLVGAVKNIEKSGIPVRYVLIDDGHQTREKKRSKIKSFDPDPVKFPHQWSTLLNLRKEHKIKWMGLWHCFNGDWSGISEENDFDAELKQHLSRTPGGVLQPKNNQESSRYFYNALIGSVKDFGFDFVKIDVQTRNLNFYRGMENAVTASMFNSQSLEEAVNRDLHGLINCMAQNLSCVFNTRYSSVTRVSQDYSLGNALKAKNHLWQSYHNIPWLGQTVWGDHDMFHSSDPFAGEIMAISKAMSGGPVYLSDDPLDFLPEYIKPLCFNDGLLIRPLAPGTPLPSSMFTNPLKEASVYSVIAPLDNGAASIVSYNLLDTVTSVTLKGSISKEDYADAGAMIQPYKGKWNLPEEGLVLYDWNLKEAHELDVPYLFEMPVLSNRLMHLCPIKKGWSVIGCPDKYLSPAFVMDIQATKKQLQLKLKEGGSVIVWNKSGRVKSDSGEVKSLGNNLWQIDVPKDRDKLLLSLEN